MKSNKNKKNIYPNSIRGTQRFTKPSRTNGVANIQINSEIAIVENPLSKIINGIVEFLKTGKYVDTTGIAFKNTSP